MKSIILIILLSVCIVPGFSQKNKPPAIALADSSNNVLADSVVVHALKSLSATATASVSAPALSQNNRVKAGSENKAITVISISSKDSSHEFLELWVLKNSKNKTLAIFNAPNPNYKSINNHVKDLIKNVQAAIDYTPSTGNINFPSYVNLSGGGTVNVPSDGSWSQWTNVGITCETEQRCLLDLIKGIKYQTSWKIRQMPTFNIGVPGIISLPGFPGIIEVEERNVKVGCGCR